MKLRLFLFSTVCLSYFVAPTAGVNLLAAAAAAKGAVIRGLAGASGHPVVIHMKPPEHIVVEHKPVTLIPVATIPSYSLANRLFNLWGGISNSISTKIQAVSDFFRGPPNIVLIHHTTHKPTTTKKPTTHHPSVILEVVGVPHHPIYPMEVPFLVEDCGNKINCVY